MKERPILMSSPMVRAILDGTKTQTRRVVKPQLESLGWNEGWFYKGGYWSHPPERCPYGQPGDRLWVRETFMPLTKGFAFRADGLWNEKAPGLAKWKPSIFMPREASRITLEVTGVRVERLQDISEADAIAEGVDYKTCPTEQTAESLRAQSAARKIGMCAHYEAAIDYVGGYRLLWDSINAKTAPWASNPWVWVVEFKRID